MREINNIILHHTASKQMSVNEYYPILYYYHVNQLGYSDVGYHYIIDKFGYVKKCRPVSQPGAHCYGQNSDSIGIALIGNFDKSNIPMPMHISLLNLISELVHKYDLQVFGIYGHCEFRKTLCPGHYGMLMVNTLRKVFCYV